jgi:hypothetical protein
MNPLYPHRLLSIAMPCFPFCWTSSRQTNPEILRISHSLSRHSYSQKMSYQISEVTLADADSLVHHCQFPAMRHDSLRAIMFPEANSESYNQEEEIKWTIEGLEESLQNKSCYIRKVTHDSNCVGYAIWTLETDGKTTRQRTTTAKQRESWNPKGLDLDAWHLTSIRLREERQRVLQDKKDILSKSASF